MLEFLVFSIAIQFGARLRFWSANESQIFIQLPELNLSSAVFALTMISAMTATGLYQRHLRDGLNGMFLRIAVAFLLGFLTIAVFFYMFPSAFIGRGVLGITFVVSMLSILLMRIIYVKVVNRTFLKRRILVVGAGVQASQIENRLRRKTDRENFIIVGYVALPKEQVAIRKENVINSDSSLKDLALHHGVDELVIAITERRKGFPTDQVLDCKLSGIEVVDVLTFFERQTGRLILEILNPSWLIFSDGFMHGAVRELSKRIFDIISSSALLILASPLMVFAAIAIFFEDRGPIFYRQVRVGQNWDLINILKFRSMRVDAEKHGAQFASKDDNRVTKIGRFIRKTRIDELPQLINVLKGDMSFVGPRPERPEFVEKFSDTIPYYAERHRIKPGITGWAQICYPYGASERDTMEKLQYDLYYVKNYSLFLDIMVLFQTAEVVLWGKGAR